MRQAIVCVLVLAASSAALSAELLTVEKTRVHERPDRNSRVLAEIAPNTKITSAEQKDFWFRVTAEVDGKTVSGWVYQFDVNNVMGRSKGQLLAENERLLAEVAQLREKVKVQAEQLKKAVEQIGAGAEEKARAEARIVALEAELRSAREEAERLKEELRKEREKGEGLLK